MTKLPFANKYGQFKYFEEAEAFVREHTYLLLSDGVELICVYDKASQLYTLPTDNDLQFNGNLRMQFSTFAYFMENAHPIKERQNYLVYNVQKSELPDATFQWCKIKDIFLNNIAFDATKLIGIKNLYVRMK